MSKLIDKLYLLLREIKLLFFEKEFQIWKVDVFIFGILGGWIWMQVVYVDINC